MSLCTYAYLEISLSGSLTASEQGTLCLLRSCSTSLPWTLFSPLCYSVTCCALPLCSLGSHLPLPFPCLGPISGISIKPLTTGPTHWGSSNNQDIESEGFIFFCPLCLGPERCCMVGIRQSFPFILIADALPIASVNTSCTCAGQAKHILPV